LLCDEHQRQLFCRLGSAATGELGKYGFAVVHETG
jgi:hypothetical protein